MRYLTLILLIPVALFAQAVPAGRGATAAGRGGTNPAAVPPPPPTPAADLATMEGQAVNAITGTPLRKTTITMNRQNRSGPLAAGTRTSYTATTDNSGRFSINGIEPGTYRVTAQHVGYLTTSYNERKPGGNGTPLDLGRAQKLTTVTLKLTPQSVITGKVVDEDGDPIQGVNVQAMQLYYNNGRKQLQSQDGEGTNDLGEFRLAGLNPGKYFLAAMYRDHRIQQLVNSGMVSSDLPQEDYATTYFPGVTDLSAAAPIDVGPGDQVTGMNLRLTRTHTVMVSGRVVNNDQPATPAPPPTANTVNLPDGSVMQLPMVVNNNNMNMQIRLVPRNAMNPNGLNVNARVKADGTFEFASVPAGAYWLLATANRGGRARSVRQQVDVGNSNVENITLAINPGISVTGHVRFDADVPDPQPVLNVRLTPREQIPGSTAPPAARVGPDGNFRFDDINPDHYNVAVNAPQTFYLKTARAGSTDALVYGLDVTNSAGNLDIVMGTNPPQVSGSVVNADAQQPAAAVQVVLIPQEKERQDQPLFYSTATSDQYGNFTFGRVLPGEYRAYAWEDVQSGQWYDPEFMKNYLSKGEPVSAKEGSPATVKLTMIPAK